MYLFILYLVAYSVKGVDLWNSNDYKVHDEAAEMVKLINFVNKAGHFRLKNSLKSNEVNEVKKGYSVKGADLWNSNDYKVHAKAAEMVKFINLVNKAGLFRLKNSLKSNKDNGVKKDSTADARSNLQSVKLLQKNYDFGNILSRILKPRRVHISNPEVIELYNKRNEDLSDMPLTRYNADELQEMYLRTNNGNRSASARDDESNRNTAEEREINDRRRNIDEEEHQNHEGSLTDLNSEETKENILPSAEMLNLVKPIIKQMLTKYIIKQDEHKKRNSHKNVDLKSLEKETSEDNENEDIESQSYSEEIHERPKNKLQYDNKKKPKLISLPKKNKENFDSNEQVEKQNKNKIFNDEKNSKDNDLKDENYDKKKTVPFSEHVDFNPIIMIESRTSSEEKRINRNTHKYKHLDENSSKELKDASYDSHNDIKGEIKDKKQKEQQNKKTRDKEDNESDTGDAKVLMDAQNIDWGDYDDKKDTHEEQSNKYDDDSKIDSHDKSDNVDVKKNLDNVNAETRDDEKIKINRFKTEKRTRRKGHKNDKGNILDFDYDNKNEDDAYSNKNNDSGNKKEEKRHKKNKNLDRKDDYNLDHKDNNSKKKKEKWHQLAIEWDKKDDEEFSKEVTKKKKKTKHPENDGNISKLKRESTDDNVATNKKKNSEWGKYDSFKNIRDKKVKYEKYDDDQVKSSPPKTDFKIPEIHNNWDNYPKRDKYYDKPKRIGQKNRMQMHRTPIPFAGKRPVYAE